MKKDYTIWYAIINFVVFLIIYLYSIRLLFVFVEPVIARIIGIVILYFICSFLEKRLLMQYVNFIVMLFFPKEVREKEKKMIREITKRRGIQEPSRQRAD